MNHQKPDEIILHCAATPNGRNFTVEDIRRWHKQRGWKDCGYHYVILIDGTIQLGRLESEIGAGVKGRNTNVIHICLIGNDEFSPAQYAALDRLYLDIHSRHKIEPDSVYGHYEFDYKKTCPNIDMNMTRIGLENLLRPTSEVTGLTET